MNIVTLVIALIGAVTGVVSLVWQTVEFRLTEGRAQVELVSAWVGPGGAVVSKAGWAVVAQQPSPHFDTPCLGVQVRNVGRLPLSIVGWWVHLGDATYGSVSAFGNKPLPHRLDVGEEATWMVPLDHVQTVVSVIRRKNPAPVPVWASVTTGHSKSVESKQRLALE